MRKARLARAMTTFRVRGRFELLALLLVCVQTAAADSPPPDYRPPDTAGICPAIAEDYLICSGDSWSGNCADFVKAAGRLGEVYRSELSAHPGWIDDLQNTIWWGCGSARLGDLRALLERIDSAEARSVLGDEPYRSLVGAPPAPADRNAAHSEGNCSDSATESERNACATRRLQQAQAAHARDFDACVVRVAPALRPELVDAETSWKKMVPLECDGDTYLRDTCLARAYAERSQSIATIHPECAAAADSQ
jgi:hypothetical protein